jgi:DegV family protein with EDD domain
MNNAITQALIIGAERVAAWANLLDSINIFPVADGDTGRNLKISLAPLRELEAGRDKTIHKLLINARGNSGNIAARFFSGFLAADTLEKITEAVKTGRDRAWLAVHDPMPGTMLTVFDALVDALEGSTVEPSTQFAAYVMNRLEEAVRSTPELIPMIKNAGVVDSGALGMFIYFEGFFRSLAGNIESIRPVTSVFNGLLSISTSYDIQEENGYCVDVTLDARSRHEETIGMLSDLGESVIVIPGNDYIKIHLHTGNADNIREKMKSQYEIVRWSDDNLEEQVHSFKEHRKNQAIHVMTDAAGSITRDDARRLGMTLLDSYVTVGDLSAPETCVDPVEIYAAMRRGVKASTSQASEYERNELYRSVTSQHERVLYLCVGSVFTGNYEVATRWKEEHDPDGRFSIIDSGAASGRLGSIALATAAFSNTSADPGAVVDFARKTIDRCREYLFIDTLKFLAAGGRMSKTQAMFGNMLNIKPIVTPTAEGVKKVGTAKNLGEQVSFALAMLGNDVRPDSSAFIMLQFTDNRMLVENSVMPEIKKRFPRADIKMQPLSLTTGVHAGPGTWSIAYIPEL